MTSLGSERGELQANLPGGAFGGEPPSQLFVDEVVEAATRFRALWPDPSGKLWIDAEQLVGQRISVSLDDGASLELAVYGRRFVYDTEAAEAFVLLWGFDDSYKLFSPRRHRAFASGSLSSVAQTLSEETGVAIQVSAAPGRRGDDASAAVQYDESDFDFLRRLAATAGMRVWPRRGEVWIGEPPANGSCEIDLADPDVGVVGFAADEDWSEEALEHRFPTVGAPFPSSPLLSAQESDAPLPTSGDRPEGEADRLSPLCGPGGSGWPIGLARDADEQQALSKAVADLQRDQRRYGVLSLSGGPPNEAEIGSVLAVKLRGSDVASARIVGVRHELTGGGRRTAIEFGRPSDFARPATQLRPARHLWTGVVVGSFQPDRATILVRPLGWDPRSDPIRARVASPWTGDGVGLVRAPLEGEFVLFGFEGGDPDAPVILGALFDGAAPEAPDGQTAWTFKTAGGGGAVQLADELLEVKLENLALSLAVGKAAIRVSKEGQIELKGSSINMLEAK